MKFKSLKIIALLFLVVGIMVYNPIVNIAPFGIDEQIGEI